MHVQIDFLTAPGSGRNTSGKFYIGIRDTRCPHIIYGANTQSGSGTKKKHASVASVEKKLREKRAAEYSNATPGQINAAAKQTVIDILTASIPGLDASSAQWQNDGVTFGGAPTKVRPKRTRRNIHAWI